MADIVQLKRDFSFLNKEPQRNFKLVADFTSSNLYQFDPKFLEYARGSILHYDNRDSGIKAYLEVAIDTISRFNNEDYIVMEPGAVIDLRPNRFERLYIRARQQWSITGDTAQGVALLGKLVVSDDLLPQTEGLSAFNPDYVREAAFIAGFGQAAFTHFDATDASGIWNYKAKLHTGPASIYTKFKYMVQNTGERMVYITDSNITSGPVPQSGSIFDTLYAKMYPIAPGESKEFRASGLPNTNAISSSFNFLDIYSQYSDAEVKYYREATF